MFNKINHWWTQLKCKWAKRTLEQYSPRGEHLAFINDDEAKILKRLGGAGQLIEPTGVKSYFLQFLLPALGLAGANLAGGAASLAGGTLSLGGGLLHAGATGLGLGVKAATGVVKGAAGLLGGGGGGAPSGGGGTGTAVGPYLGARPFSQGTNVGMSGQTAGRAMTGGGGGGSTGTVGPMPDTGGDIGSGGSPAMLFLKVLLDIRRSVTVIEKVLGKILGVKAAQEKAQLLQAQKQQALMDLTGDETDDSDGDGEKKEGKSPFKGLGKKLASTWGKTPSWLKTAGFAGLMWWLARNKDVFTKWVVAVLDFFRGNFGGKGEGSLSARWEEIWTKIKDSGVVVWEYFTSEDTMADLWDKIKEDFTTKFLPKLQTMVSDFMIWVFGTIKDSILRFAGMDKQTKISKNVMEYGIEREKLLKAQEGNVPGWDKGQELLAKAAMMRKMANISDLTNYRVIFDDKVDIMDRKPIFDGKEITWGELDKIMKMIKAQEAPSGTLGQKVQELGSIDKVIISEADDVMDVWGDVPLTTFSEHIAKSLMNKKSDRKSKADIRGSIMSEKEAFAGDRDTHYFDQGDGILPAEDWASALAADTDLNYMEAAFGDINAMADQIIKTTDIPPDTTPLKEKYGDGLNPLIEARKKEIELKKLQEQFDLLKDERSKMTTSVQQTKVQSDNNIINQDTTVHAPFDGFNRDTTGKKYTGQGFSLGAFQELWEQ